jgi:hypothetical protein
MRPGHWRLVKEDAFDALLHEGGREPSRICIEGEDAGEPARGAGSPGLCFPSAAYVAALRL